VLLIVPTYEKLDRVLASTEWEQKFPLVTVDALNREISDHIPFCLAQARGCIEVTNLSSNLNIVGSFKRIFSKRSRVFGEV